jgi:hypothetical protein
MLNGHIDCIQTTERPRNEETGKEAIGLDLGRAVVVFNAVVCIS